MVYQPMLERLGYLRANGVKTYIVSGGGIEFMRPWAQRVYGVPPEQVVGSSIKVKYEMIDSGPVLARQPEIDFIDDKAGNPVGIYKFIGKAPIIAWAIPTGICRCCNGRRSAVELGLVFWFTTRTKSANGRTTASPM